MNAYDLQDDMPEEIFELIVDKFTFRVPKGLYYSEAGVWVKSVRRGSYEKDADYSFGG